MNKKTFNLIVGLVGGCSTIAVALVTFFEPAYAVAINTSIGIGATAITEIVAQFVKEDK